jgi:hypothetical protein
MSSRRLGGLVRAKTPRPSDPSTSEVASARLLSPFQGERRRVRASDARSGRAAGVPREVIGSHVAPASVGRQQRPGAIEFHARRPGSRCRAGTGYRAATSSGGGSAWTTRLATYSPTRARAEHRRAAPCNQGGSQRRLRRRYGALARRSTPSRSAHPANCAVRLSQGPDYEPPALQLLARRVVQANSDGARAPGRLGQRPVPRPIRGPGVVRAGKVSITVVAVPRRGARARTPTRPSGRQVAPSRSAEATAESRYLLDGRDRHERLERDPWLLPHPARVAVRSRRFLRRRWHS